MKITPKQYAILLYELTKDAKSGEVDKCVKSFLELLVKNRNLSLLSRIELLYKDYFDEQEGMQDIEVITASKITEKVIAGIKGNIDAKKLNIQMKVNKNVIGGASIKVGDYMVDDTLKARLAALKQNLNR